MPESIDPMLEEGTAPVTFNDSSMDAYVNHLANQMKHQKKS